jgi:hypothetical protein
MTPNVNLNSERLPAIKLNLKPNVISSYQNPFQLQKELVRCKNVVLNKIKFAKIINDASLLIIATDDRETHAELSKPWPIDAFTSGVTTPKRKATSIRATVHRVPIDIDVNDCDVLAELKVQGITAATRRINKATNSQTEYVSIQVESKEAMSSLLHNQLRLALCRFKVSQDQKILQCFNCQKVGHTSSSCPNSTVCLRCGGNHHHKDCSATLKCANCDGPHAACARKCPTLKPAPKPTQQPISATTATSNQVNKQTQGKSWSSVVSNKPPTGSSTPTQEQLQTMINDTIDAKLKPVIELLVKLTTEITLLLSHREVFSLPTATKLNTATQHINNTTHCSVNSETTLQSVQNLIRNALHIHQANTTTTQAQQTQPSQQQQQQINHLAKRKSRSPSPQSNSESMQQEPTSITDLNNTMLDVSNTNHNNSTASCSRITSNNNNNGNASKVHNSSRHPNKLTRQSTSTLLNKTISQANKENVRNHNA